MLKNCRGFTLIELIGSVMVFVIGLAALLGVCLQSVTQGKRADMAYTAYNLAKNQIESLRAIDFDELSDAEETDAVLNAQGVADPDGEFIRNTDVTTNYSGDSNVTQLTVTVDYLVKGVSLQPMSMTTTVYNE